MKVEQAYTFVNNAYTQVIGKGPVLMEDLSNIVDVGEEVFNTGSSAVDAVTKSLIDQIGRVVFVSRVYTGRAPSVFMDSWEYQSVVEKIDMDTPETQANQSWALQDGSEYKQDVFKQPKVHTKFYNGKITFEVQISKTEHQLKSAFSGVNQLMGFLGMIETVIANRLAMDMDDLIMATINNLMAETIFDEYPTAEYNTKSTVKAVNLLKLYNDQAGKTLTKDKIFTDKEFLRFSAWMMGVYQDRLATKSVLFNIGGRERFTPKDKLHTVMLSPFYRAAQTYLESDTWHNELVKLPKADTVAYWQGSSTDYTFDSCSKINIKHDTHTVELSGILAVMFDHDALGVTQKNQRTTMHYNAAAEFYNSWYKIDAHYFNDTNENCVVFFVA